MYAWGCVSGYLGACGLVGACACDGCKMCKSAWVSGVGGEMAWEWRGCRGGICVGVGVCNGVGAEVGVVVSVCVCGRGCQYM